MIQNFEIMKIFDLHNRGQFILARHIEVGSNFELKEGSNFGGILIYQYLDMPRMIDENQQQRLDVFVFRPLDRFPSEYFKEGQFVELLIPEHIL
jgi:hypothetical protein